MITDLVFLESNSIEEIMCSYDSSIGLWYQAKNIDMIALSKLGEMLQVGDYKSLSRGFNLVSEPDEQMLFTIPLDLQSKLSCLSDEEITKVSDNWQHIDEFRGGMTAISCVNYLTDVRAFLNKSSDPVYLKMAA